MADIINTLRGPRVLPSGTVRGYWYIIPVMEPFNVKLGDLFRRKQQHDREYYQHGADGEWHWSHTEPAGYQKYPPAPEPPEWPLPEGV